MEQGDSPLRHNNIEILERSDWRKDNPVGVEALFRLFDGGLGARSHTINSGTPNKTGEEEEKEEAEEEEEEKRELRWRRQQGQAPVAGLVENTERRQESKKQSVDDKFPDDTNCSSMMYSHHENVQTPPRTTLSEPGSVPQTNSLCSNSSKPLLHCAALKKLLILAQYI
ncbi:unnamed protein product [Pleuronectes platessa]|uniref:Uncharacterized protein n=1 Tax=Pleuronectes platessa TaxID=8262 RepID=A0A9N7YBN6_PLEPL|nr:unnamed protein product [Pleuronectes platessa]